MPQIFQMTLDIPQQWRDQPSSSRLISQLRLDLVLIPIVLMVFVATWQTIVWVGNYPTFILPAPTDVGQAFIQAFTSGTLWYHAKATLFEVFAGLALGLTSATILGYLLAKNQLLEKIATPYLVAMQAIPVVAIAPLLIIWLGSGYLSKVMVCALIVFFPFLINTIVGIRSVEPNLRNLMRSLEASRWQTFIMLELPAALPILLGGLKVSVTLSVIGAVVGEFMGANQGLGFLINQARGLFNTPLVFVAIFTLVAITLTLYGCVSLLEKRLLRWQQQIG